MSRSLRALLVVAAVTSVMSMASPVSAATDDDVDVFAGDCVVAGGSAVRTVHVTPGAPVAEDVAYNLDDPDAEDSPLELIRFPDETALWLSAGGGSLSGLVTGGADLGIPETSVRTFSGGERSDRAVSDSIVRLYCGLFGRQPDPFELEYWAGRYWNGLPLTTIAESFTNAHEFVNRYGVLTDAGLVDVLYRDVLGRDAGIGGVEAMLVRLDSGEMHRGQVVVQFTESSEYVRRTNTAAPRKPALPYPDVGSGRRIILTDSGQRVWLVEATGELYKTHQVSGRRGIPGVGRYNVYSMSRYAWAPYDGITMEFMVRFARGEWPYGFHSIPVWPDESPLQVPAQLGTHRSGGCIRQLWDDAQAVFEWAEIGDRVVLIP